jgi:hypothetical protein
MIRNQLPLSLSKENFEESILSRLITEEDKSFINNVYLLSGNNYVLNKNMSDDDAVKTLKILNSADYKNKKVLIFKIPITMDKFLY